MDLAVGLLFLEQQLVDIRLEPLEINLVLLLIFPDLLQLVLASEIRSIGYAMFTMYPGTVTVLSR